LLSIGKLAAGQHEYYLALAQEDYYVGGVEPPGLWWGRGAERLGLLGLVVKETLRLLFDGFHPDTKAPLVQNPDKTRRPGFDLTFSAPKSVSILWALVPERRDIIEACHEGAVKEALGYLEDTAAFTRRGKGGIYRVPVSLVAALFEHGTSRALDPQLHTHCLILNVGVSEDGRTATLDGRALFQAKMEAGHRYQSALARSLTQELGLSVTFHPKGYFSLEEVPQALLQEFSKRRHAIEAELKRRGFSSAVAAAKACMHTRESKYEVPRDTLFEEWKQVAERLGLYEKVQDLLQSKSPPFKKEPPARPDLLSPSDRRAIERALSNIALHAPMVSRPELSKLCPKPKSPGEPPRVSGDLPKTPSETLHPSNILKRTLDLRPLALKGFPQGLHPPPPDRGVRKALAHIARSTPTLSLAELARRVPEAKLARELQETRSSASASASSKETLRSVLSKEPLSFAQHHMARALLDPTAPSCLTGLSLNDVKDATRQAQKTSEAERRSLLGIATTPDGERRFRELGVRTSTLSALFLELDRETGHPTLLEKIRENLSLTGLSRHLGPRGLSNRPLSEMFPKLATSIGRLRERLFPVSHPLRGTSPLVQYFRRNLSLSSVLYWGLRNRPLEDALEATYRTATGQRPIELKRLLPQGLLKASPVPDRLGHAPLVSYFRNNLSLQGLLRQGLSNRPLEESVEAGFRTMGLTPFRPLQWLKTRLPEPLSLTRRTTLLIEGAEGLPLHALDRLTREVPSATGAKVILLGGKGQESRAFSLVREALEAPDARLLPQRQTQDRRTRPLEEDRRTKDRPPSPREERER
jgi:conjugative relaxase-like TrwC/TraI family protein